MRKPWRIGFPTEPFTAYAYQKASWLVPAELVAPASPLVGTDGDGRDQGARPLPCNRLIGRGVTVSGFQAAIARAHSRA